MVDLPNPLGATNAIARPFRATTLAWRQVPPERLWRRTQAPISALRYRLRQLGRPAGLG